MLDVRDGEVGEEGWEGVGGANEDGGEGPFAWLYECERNVVELANEARLWVVCQDGTSNHI